MSDPTAAEGQSFAADLRRWLFSLTVPELTRLARFHLLVAAASTLTGAVVIAGDPSLFRSSWLASMTLAWAATGVYSRRATLLRKGKAGAAAVPQHVPSGTLLQPERRDWWRDRYNVGD